MHDEKKLSFTILVLIICSEIHSADAQLIRAFYEFGMAARDLFNNVSKTVAPHLKALFDTTPSSISVTSNKDDGEKDVNKTEIHDCFGLGHEVAETLETWLKGNTNSSDDVKVKFFINTRKTLKREEITHGDQFDLEKTDFNINRKTILIVHGFMSNGQVDWIKELEEALLKWDDVNVIIVDWSDRHFSINYFKSARSTEAVGNQIATFLHKVSTYTTEKYGLNKEHWGPLHLIGHSLGAHICGYTSYEIKKRNADWTVHRITGLDPARICFESSDSDLIKLDSDDAPFVDIIHTNAKGSIVQGLSLFKPLGHFDFYPNGGKHQPGCTDSNFILPDAIKLPRKMIHEIVCNHGKSYLYFTESIINSIAKNCTFWAKPWDMTEESAEKMIWDSCNAQMCIEMGINSAAYYNGNKGAFFVLTSGSAPFCSVTKREEIIEVEKILEDNKDKQD